MSDPTVTPHDSAAPATAPGSAPLPQGTVYYTPGMHAENIYKQKKIGLPKYTSTIKQKQPQAIGSDRRRERGHHVDCRKDE